MCPRELYFYEFPSPRRTFDGSRGIRLERRSSDKCAQPGCSGSLDSLRYGVDISSACFLVLVGVLK